jgi:fermentation-respiration switch protein FrsA (DUF1100 family)
MKTLMTFLFTIAGGYLILVVLMVLFQDKLLFMSSREMIQTPESAGLKAEELRIDTEDSVQIHGWYFPNEDSGKVIVLSHGNAGNISYRIDIARTLLNAGASVVMYDYRGYGLSKGKPSEDGFYKDITAVTHFLIEQKEYSEENIYMYGRSLGGAIAAYAATRFNVGGLVLDSSFINLRSMVKDVYPFVPSALAKYKFPANEYLKQLENTPVLIMHSREDEIVGYHNGEELYETAKSPKKFIDLKGGHNENFYLSRDLIEKNWRDFLSEEN